jgi:DNA-binding NarL/FixJ family response regulator
LDDLPIRILMVDDFEPWRRLAFSLLQGRPELQIVGEASDGPEAIQKAQELQPHLILLDIGLPTLSGIEVARRIRMLAPEIKIIFVSQVNASDMAEEALSAGGDDYVVKAEANTELLTAIDNVLHGNRFFGPALSDSEFAQTRNSELAAAFPRPGLPPARATLQNQGINRHEVRFYSNDASFLEEVTEFLASALHAGDSATVIATHSHRDALLQRLQSRGIDLQAAIEQGRYIALDAADTISTFMHNGLPDPVRYLDLVGNLIAKAAQAANKNPARVAFFGECVHLLWTQGNSEAAIRVEKIVNRITSSHNVDVLCGYCFNSTQPAMDSQVFLQICAEHSAVHSDELRLPLPTCHL